MSRRTILRLILARTKVGAISGRIPAVKKAYAKYALWRRDHTGIFSGMYGTYEEARADIPAQSLLRSADAARWRWVGSASDAASERPACSDRSSVTR